MTFRVSKSYLIASNRLDSFDDDVRRGVADINDWRRHQSNVEREINEGTSPRQFEPYPHPVLEDVVQSCIDVTGRVAMSDYVIEDDTQEVAQIACEKQRRLHNVAIDLWEREQYDNIMPKSQQRKLIAASSSISSIHVDDMTDEQKQLTSEYAEYVRRVSAIREHATRMYEEVEELTVSNVLSWVVRPIEK